MSEGFKATKELKDSLSHVLWIGGASDSGKSTVMRILAERHRWQIYPCDFHEHNHFIARADPASHPAMYSGLGKTIDDTWVYTTPEAMFHDILTTNDERFPMICEDLQGMPKWPKILVEGPRLFPKLVRPLLSDIHQAIWLLPTEEFALESAAKRDKPQLRMRSSDPERFQSNFFGREALLREYLRQEVLSRGLPYIEVDGSDSVDKVARRVEAHFESYLI
ncbi:hypothetical protein [Paenibacillus ginsengarvi]|uniref:Uncharacterized protein n=1 Tax=Paenibacillus ginsengarvi TaxID=400777 RepID=A0A3B0CN92_9BACL|nr:hypothetical protein [Paenibacillus ginsengarvi]RKN86341.1 hypothetical protein D7M11_04835 [Paenibacillus ginsengarvi]